MSEPRTPAEVVEHNAAVLAARPRPGLDFRYRTYIAARDPAGFVLVGGLGGMGMGQMWMQDEPRMREKPGYDDAPIERRTQ